MVSKKTKYSVAAALFVIGVSVVIFSWHTPGRTQGSTYVNTTSSTPPNSATTNTTGTLFASVQYAQFAYLISNNTLSSQAQAALAGFNLSRTQYNNGTTLMGITLIGSVNKQTLTLKPGYKLYIIEASFGDDSFGGESNLGDDGFVEVSPNGYIVQ